MTVVAAFAGGSSNIRSTTGTDLTMTGLTVGALLYSTSSVANDGVILSTLSGGAPQLVFAASWDTGHYYLSPNGANVSSSSALPPATSVWHFVMLSKATGTNIIRAHGYNGTSWAHADADTGVAIADPSSSVDSVQIGDINGLGANLSNLMNLALVGIWNETTDDSTAETYLNYTTLAAKSNARFFTGRSLINAGTMDDSGSGNNDETARTSITTGTNHVPSWFTNFSMTPADYPPRRPRNLWVARGRGRTTRSR